MSRASGGVEGGTATGRDGAAIRRGLFGAAPAAVALALLALAGQCSAQIPALPANAAKYTVGSSTAVLGSTVYVFGYDESGMGGSVLFYMSLNPVGQWQFVDEISPAVFSPAVVTTRSAIFVFGGAVNSQTPSAQVFSFIPSASPQASDFVSLSPMTNPLMYGAASPVYGGAGAVVCGGQTAPDTPTSICQLYDVAGDSWSLVAPMLYSKWAHGMATAEGTVYAFGGYMMPSLAAELTNDVHALNLSANSWRIVYPQLRAAVGFMGLAVYNCEVLLMGGINIEGSQVSNVTMFQMISPANVTTERQARMQPLSQYRSNFLGAGYAGLGALAIGGAVGNTGTISAEAVTDFCRTGYTGEHCDRCAFGYGLVGGVCTMLPGVDLSDPSCGGPCSGRGNVNASMDCVCNAPFAGTACLQCLVMFRGQQCDECQYGYYGPMCASCPGEGPGAPACSGHGYCDGSGSHGGSGVCECFAGWTGARCDLCTVGYFGANCVPCTGPLGAPCSLHGLCRDGHAGDGSCTCMTGFSGFDCSVCEGTTCMTQCPLGMYGRTCALCMGAQLEPVAGGIAVLNGCSGHGLCGGNGTAGGDGACSCDVGWTGTACEVCSTGYFGPSCAPCPGVAEVGARDAYASECYYHGVCVGSGTSGGSGACTCNAGWTGTDCSQWASCPVQPILLFVGAAVGLVVLLQAAFYLRIPSLRGLLLLFVPQAQVLFMIAHRHAERHLTVLTEASVEASIGASAVASTTRMLQDMALAFNLDFTGWRYLQWCSYSSPYYVYMYMWPVPLLLPLLFVVTYAPSSMCRLRAPTRDSAQLEQLLQSKPHGSTRGLATPAVMLPRVIEATLWIATLWMPVVLQKCLEALQCDKAPVGDPNRAALSCDDEARPLVLPAAAAIFGLYCVGLPAAIWADLRRLRGGLCGLPQGQEIEMLAPADPPGAKPKGDVQLVCVTSVFADGKAMWLLLLLLRRVVTVIAISSIPGSLAFSIPVMFLNVAWCIGRETIRPFRHGRTLTLDRVTCALELFTMISVCNMDAALLSAFDNSHVVYANATRYNASGTGAAPLPPVPSLDALVIDTHDGTFGLSVGGANKGASAAAAFVIATVVAVVCAAVYEYRVGEEERHRGHVGVREASALLRVAAGGDTQGADDRYRAPAPTPAPAPAAASRPPEGSGGRGDASTAAVVSAMGATTLEGGGGGMAASEPAIFEAPATSAPVMAQRPVVVRAGGVSGGVGGQTSSSAFVMPTAAMYGGASGVPAAVAAVSAMPPAVAMMQAETAYGQREWSGIGGLAPPPGAAQFAPVPPRGERPPTVVAAGTGGGSQWASLGDRPAAAMSGGGGGGGARGPLLAPPSGEVKETSVGSIGSVGSVNLAPQRKKKKKGEKPLDTKALLASLGGGDSAPPVAAVKMRPVVKKADGVGAEGAAADRGLVTVLEEDGGRCLGCNSPYAAGTRFCKQCGQKI